MGNCQALLAADRAPSLASPHTSRQNWRASTASKSIGGYSRPLAMAISFVTTLTTPTTSSSPRTILVVHWWSPCLIFQVGEHGGGPSPQPRYACPATPTASSAVGLASISVVRSAPASPPEHSASSGLPGFTTLKTPNAAISSES